MMRIRLPFAGGFLILLLLAAYLGLSSLQIPPLINDKLLHFLVFFALTTIFYWIIDTNRRRTLNLTLVVCTLGLGVGSEFLQGFLPNGREFDPWDILANIVGSLSGLALCGWYHKRMLERKRERRGGRYGVVHDGEEGEDEGILGGDGGEEDAELGLGSSRQDIELEDRIATGGSYMAPAETPEPATVIGTSNSTGNGNANGAAKKMTLEEEVDNWDENADDGWDEAEEPPAAAEPPILAAAPKKHAD